MALNTKLDLDQCSKSVLEKAYRGMISSILYLIASALDIMFSVCFCVRF